MVKLLKVDRDRRAAHVLVAGRRGAAKGEDVLDIGNVLDLFDDQLGRAVGILQRRAGGKFNRNSDTAAVIRRDERAGDAHQGHDGQRHRRHGGHKGQVIAAERHPADMPAARAGLDEGEVATGKYAVLVLKFRAGIGGFHQVSGHHGGDEARHQQREHHGHGNRDAELTEILAGDAGHEADGHEDRDDGGRGRDDGEADFVGGLDCRLERGFAHPHVPGYVLDLDDGVIDKDAGGQRQGQEGHEVQREAEHVHHPEGRDGRQGQRDGGNQRGAPVLEEHHDHDDGEERAFQQRVDGGLVVAIGEKDRVIDLLDRHLGMGGLDLVQRGIDGFGDRNLGRALGAEHREGHDLLIIQAREAAQFLVGVDDAAQIGQHDMAARGQGDGGGREAVHGGGVADGADRLFARAEIGAATAKIGVGLTQLCRNGLRGDAEAVELDRVQLDPDLAVGAAVTVHPANTGAALQLALHDVVNEVGDLFKGQRRGRDREGHDRLTLDVELGHIGGVDIGGQIGLDGVNGVLDVLQRLGGGHVHAKLDHRHRDAAGHVGLDVLDPVDAGHGVFDLLGDLGFHLGRGRTGLADRNEDEGHVDIRKAGDRQGVEALPADDEEDDEGQKGRYGIADGPG